MTAARVMTINVRRSTYNVGPSWDSRKATLLNTIVDVDHGPPSVILTQECTKEQMMWLAEKLGYNSYGNGQLNGTALSGDKDISADNVSVLWNPSDWEYQARWHGWVNTAHKRYVRAVDLTRRGSGERVWFATTHLSLVSTTMRIYEAKSAVKLMQNDGINLKRMVFGGDWNESTMFPSRSVRAALREYGFKDLRTLLPDADVVGDSWATHHGWKATKKTGKWLDDILLGKLIKARFARVIETNSPIPSKGGTDHHGVLAGIEI